MDFPNHSLPLVGDVIILHGSLVTNAERETSSMTEILSKPSHRNGCMCRVTMSRELDHDR